MKQNENMKEVKRESFERTAAKILFIFLLKEGLKTIWDYLF